jgi:hypothetical protein
MHDVSLLFPLPHVENLSPLESLSRVDSRHRDISTGGSTVLSSERVVVHHSSLRGVNLSVLLMPGCTTMCTDSILGYVAVTVTTPPSKSR